MANVATTHYILGSAVGPAPYPAIVRDLQRVIGDEAREELLRRAGRLPDRVVACVGGGSNAIGMFAAFVGDAEVALVGVEAAGEGLDSGRHGAPLTAGGTPGVLHGSLSAVLQDGDGQITEAHSVSAGLDYPGSGPEHAWLRDSGRATYVAVTDEQALAAYRLVAEREGIIPALETAHAFHHVLHEPSDATLDLLCLSGRGDKDLAEVIDRRERRAGEASPRRSPPRASAPRSCPTSWAGSRTWPPPRRSGWPTRTAAPTSSSSGCRSPTRWPTARSSTRRAPRRCRRGPRWRACSASAGALSPRLPVVVMCYSNLVLVRTADHFCAALAEAGASGLIVPDLPLEEAPVVQEACDAHGIARIPLVAPTTPDERLARIGADAQGFLYTVSVTGTTGERSSASFDEIVGRAKAHTDVPVALGFGIGTPEQAAAAAAAGADGVIVGSRLVREAADAEDPSVRCVTSSRRWPGPFANLPARMALVLWVTSALVLWIVLWSLGAKAWDAWMLAVLIIVVGATIGTLKRYRPRSRS